MTIFGFSLTAVARRLGKAGLKPAQAIAAIQKKEPKAAASTIRTQVQAGRAGERGTPAPLNKTQLNWFKTAGAAA